MLKIYNFFFKLKSNAINSISCGKNLIQVLNSLYLKLEISEITAGIVKPIPNIHIIQSKIIIMDNSSAILIVPRRNKYSKYRTSEFPKAYIPESLYRDIQTVRTYYEILQKTPEKNYKPIKSRIISPIKNHQRIQFHFRSLSTNHKSFSDKNLCTKNAVVRFRKK